jgi:hypothetical protein
LQRLGRRRPELHDDPLPLVLVRTPLFQRFGDRLALGVAV